MLWFYFEKDGGQARSCQETAIVPGEERAGASWVDVEVFD